MVSTTDVLDFLSDVGIAVRSNLPKGAREADAIRLLLCHLSYAGFFWRNNCGVAKTAAGRPVRFGGITGAPDLIGIIGGVFVGIEVKMGNRRQTHGQVKWQNACEDAGGIYVLMRF